MSGLRSQGSHCRRSAAVPVALAALLLLVSPVRAYRVFFDYDQDANRGTFQNEVIGPDTVPVKLVVELDKDDGTPPWIHFSIHWSCEDDFLLGRGTILNETCCSYPTEFPFTRVTWERCHLANCWCESSREFLADFRTPVPEGTWVLTTLELSRTGYPGMVHDSVDFWIDCPACDYEDGDDLRRSMTIRDPDATLARTAWGRTKSHYR